MIYQHRLIVARSGRLEKRNAIFEKEMLASLDNHGSVLIGAWEILLGNEAGSGVYQIRQFDSLADWERHQQRVRDDRLQSGRREQLYPQLDAVDTAILRLAEGSPALPASWPSVETLRAAPRAWYEQRIIHLRPDAVGAHHQLYREDLAPALAMAGTTLVAHFDTVIGPGTVNGGSLRSVELRRFDDLACWQRWRERQDSDETLRRLVRERWAATVDRVDSQLMRPLPYSRLR